MLSIRVFVMGLLSLLELNVPTRRYGSHSKWNSVEIEGKKGFKYGLVNNSFKNMLNNFSHRKKLLLQKQIARYISRSTLKTHYSLLVTALSSLSLVREVSILWHTSDKNLMKRNHKINIKCWVLHMFTCSGQSMDPCK